jgi:hypothetical protein
LIFGNVTIDGTGNGSIAIAGSGVITVHGDIVNTNAEIFSNLTLEHWFTYVSSYEYEFGTSFQINGSHFSNQQVFFEMNMCVQNSGKTAYAQIYNITDGNVLANSEITTTFVGNYDGGRGIFTTWDLVRSSALTFPSGLKKYGIQVKQSSGGGPNDTANFGVGRLVITQL